MTSVIYLDYAAATPLDGRVLAAMEPLLTTEFYNPSSPYAPAIAVRRQYEAAKDTIAHILGAKGDELVMTAGATESINLAFAAVRGHVVTSAVEHHAVLAAAAQHEHTLVAVNSKGRVSPEVVGAAVRTDTELVSIQVANNEIGTLQPLSDIAQVVEQERARRHTRGDTRPIYLHSDASQGLGLLDIKTARLGVDMLTINAGKVYGPKQVGALWASRRVALQPLIFGGGQERGVRSGTENVAGVVGFATALTYAQKVRQAEVERIGALRDAMKRRLLAAFPAAVFSGDAAHQLVNFLHISFPGLDGERILFALEARGVLVATGSACAASKGTRSHVLMAIGMTPDVADGSLRMTLGRHTTMDEIERAADHIIEVVQKEQERVS